MAPAPPTAEAKPPSLRWYQYSLRSLFVLTILVAVVMSFVAVQMQNSRRQKAAIAEIEKAGGDVQLGNASEKYYVFLNSCPVDDKLLKAMIPHIKALEPICSLELCDTQITDESVDLLAQVRIEVLQIMRTKISAKGAAELHRRLLWTCIDHESLKYP